MTEDEKTIKAWLYEKLMNVLCESAHSYIWDDVTFNDKDIIDFIKLMAPDCWKAIEVKLKMEKEKKNDEV